MVTMLWTKLGMGTMNRGSGIQMATERYGKSGGYGTGWGMWHIF